MILQVSFNKIDKVLMVSVSCHPRPWMCLYITEDNLSSNVTKLSDFSKDRDNVNSN